jgi:hypothetical protein
MAGLQASPVREWWTVYSWAFTIVRLGLWIIHVGMTSSPGATEGGWTMIPLRRYALVLLFMYPSLQLPAQDSALKDASFTGKDWAALPASVQTFLVLGYISGYQAGRDDWTECIPKKPYQSPLLSVGEWRAGIDYFYANPKNTIIEFPGAMLWVRFKAEGGKADELNRLETELRGEASIGRAQQ